MYYPQMDFNNFPAFTGTDKQLEELLSSQQDLNAFYQQQQYQSSTASTPVMSNATLSADVLLQDLLFDDTPSSSNTHTRRSSFSSTDSIMDSLHNMSFASPAKNTLDAFMPSNSPLSELDLFALFSSPVPQALALPKPQSFQQPNLTLDMTLLASQQQPDFDSYFFTGPEAISTTDFKIETMDSEESTPTAGAADLIAPLMRKPSTKSVKKKTVTKRRSSSSTPSSSPDTRDRNHECETCHARFLRLGTNCRVVSRNQFVSHYSAVTPKKEKPRNRSCGMDTDTKIPSEFRVERRGWIWVESSSEATQTNQQKEEEPPENETIFPPYPDPVPPNFNMQYQASSTMMPMCSTSSNDEIDQLLAFQPSELSAFYFASQQQQPVNYPNNINAEDVLQQLMFHTAESVSTSMLSTRRPSIASEPGFILENTMFSSPEMCKFDTFMPSGPSQFEMNLFGFGASPTQTHQLLPPPKPPTSSLSLDMTGFSIPNTSNFQSFFTTATIMNQPISSDSTPSTTPTAINAPVPSKPSVAEIITPFLHKPRAYKKISKTKSLPPVNDTRARDHICDVCNAKFLRHQDLHRHKAVHSTSRDYACLWNCGSTFARADAVTRHMKKRTCRNAPPLED